MYYLPIRCFFVFLKPVKVVTRCKDTEYSDMSKTNKEKIAEISARIDTIIECCATTPNNFAKVLGYSRAQTIYDIQNRKCAPSYDFFNRFTDSEYSAIINLRWLLNGEGEMWTDFMRRLTHEEQIIVVDNVNHGISVSSYQVATEVDIAVNRNTLNELQKENGELRSRAKLADKYYKTTLEQAKQIGRLEARIEELEQRLGKTAGDANIGGTANAG